MARAEKSVSSVGTAASNPAMSSMPGSVGSAMVKSVAVKPTTASRASMPDQSRYCAQRLVRVHAAGPGLVVGVDHERVDLDLVRDRPQHRQRAVGAAERQIRTRP